MCRDMNCGCVRAHGDIALLLITTSAVFLDVGNFSRSDRHKEFVLALNPLLHTCKYISSGAFQQAVRAVI